MTLGIVCAVIESGCSLSAMNLEDDCRAFKIFRWIAGTSEDSIDLDEDSMELIKSVQLLLRISEATGASFTPIFFPILEARSTGGFCQRARSRTALRAVALAMQSGQSVEESILTFLLITPDFVHSSWPDDPVEEFANYLQEPSFNFFKDWFPHLKESGASISMLLLFISGKAIP